MRFSLTKILQGLLCTTPILLLTLAACGGGGGGTTSTAPLATYYNLGVAVSGVNGTLELTNGGDNLTVTADGSYKFGAVPAGASYNVTVLNYPPLQLCTVTNPSSNISGDTVLPVNCQTAYSISTTISGLTGTGLVLQNDSGDNLLIPTSATYSFKTPVPSGSSHTVTVLSQPTGQTCTPTTISTGSISTNTNVGTITCSTNAAVDRYAYAANFGNASVSAYTINTGAPVGGLSSNGTPPSAGTNPSSVAVDPAGTHAYVTNQSISQSTGSVSIFNISSGALSVQVSSIATGNQPAAIKIHPSGSFAYVVNKISNNISAYTIDPSNGALTASDADGGQGGIQYTIPTKVNPVAMAFDPSGAYAFVANADGNVSDYRVDTVTGALTPNPVNGVSGAANYISTGGSTPYAIAVDPAGTYLYVANRNSNDVTIFNIGSGGTLTVFGPHSINEGTIPGLAPVSIAFHPSGLYAYVVNADSGTVNVYDVNTGALNLKSQVTTGILPVSISIDSSGQYAYVANSGANTISVYQISSGNLSWVATTPVAAGTSPNAVTTAR
jgi:6-phosphogluconolactonase